MRGRPHEAVNQRAQLTKAYQELGKELSSKKLRVVGNYTLGKVIGEGTYGKVRMGTHRLTSTRVAIKQIPKEMSAQLTREIHHHRRLHHPNVTQLYEVIATEHSIWLITELCSGGELFDYLVEKGRVSESETRRLFGQLCLAMHYVHSSGAVHRDLKLENVLLDDRCNIKIGDFGFTREFEAGRMLDTFCGTTGYAAPEMLLGEKYSGPEVDIWSLGIILHCLLTGTLPFDDDDEDIMKAKIIACQYDDLEWLDPRAQGLIRSILRRNPSERLPITQILVHPWFTEPEADVLASPPPLDLNNLEPYQHHPDSDYKPLPDTPHVDIAAAVMQAFNKQATLPEVPETSESSSSASDAHHSAAPSDENSVPTSELFLTTVTTPDTDPYPLNNASEEDQLLGVQRSWSQATLVKAGGAGISNFAPLKQMESNPAFPTSAAVGETGSDFPSRSSSFNRGAKSSAPPPSSFPSRTPARTKRRSVSSSNISAPTSPTEPSFPSAALGISSMAPPDYAGLLAATAPIIFSTPLERRLLNGMSALGFDTAQIVHSVLTDACDSTGAIWWLLKRKAERREAAEVRRIAEERQKTLDALGDSSKRSTIIAGVGRDASAAANISLADTSLESVFDFPRPSLDNTSLEGREYPFSSGPTSPVALSSHETFQTLDVNPQISFVPPTPTNMAVSEPHTPPHSTIRSQTPGASTSTLNPEGHESSSSVRSSAPPSTPSTPKGRANGKPRSGSVSMLQRAAGLVRKKSDEKVREKDEAAAEAAAAAARLLGQHGRVSESTSALSHAGSHASLSMTSLGPSVGFPAVLLPMKSSPSLSKGKDRAAAGSGTEDFKRAVTSGLTPGSPWTPLESASPAHTPPLASRPSFKFSPAFLSTHDENLLTNSFNDNPQDLVGSGSSKTRTQRVGILTTFKTWFNEDKKKTKAKANSNAAASLTAPPSSFPASYALTPVPSNSARSRGAGQKTGRKKNGFRHDKRPSISSRRSSSVNSRRSSVTSIQPRRPADIIVTSQPASSDTISRQRSDPSRRSLGSRTPTSELGSRPSSVRSFNRTPMVAAARNHRRPRSPSQSSTGSSRARHTASPLQQYHRRIGSGSSSRIVRQVHQRNLSQASSAPSSRPGSSDNATFPDADLGVIRSGTPSRERKHGTPVFVAHKQSNVFGGPMAGRASIGRTGWKKSWGAEPPGWQSRTGHAPREIESFSDPGHDSVRDVFIGRQSLDPNDDSDWEDMDDEGPTFVGGLGQLSALLTGGLAMDVSSSALPPSPSLKSKRDLPLMMGAKSRSAPTRRPTSAPPPRLSPADGAVGRSTTHRASPTPPLISLTPEAAPVPSESAHPPSHNTGPRGRRQIQGGRPGQPFENPIQEEDEDEGA